LKNILKNRLIFVRDRGEELHEDINGAEELVQNRISGIEPKVKKKIHPAVTLTIFAVVVVAAALLIIKFYKKPDLFSPDKIKSQLVGSEIKDIPEMKTSNLNLERGKKSFYKGNFNDAISEFESVVESDAPDTEKSIALTYMGIIYDDRGEYKKAIEYYQRALKYDKNNVVTYRNLALAYKHMGDLDEAAHTIEKGLELDPGNVNNQILLGNILYEKGDLIGALMRFEKALEIDSNNATALYNLALTLIKKGDEVNAIEYLKRAGDADKIGEIARLAYGKLGVIYTQRKDYDQAQKFLKLAISIAPKDPVNRYNLGIVYLNLNETEKAVEEFMQAEELGKSDVDLLENLGDAYFNMRKYDRSLQTYNRLLEINSRNIRILSRVAEIYYENGELDRAYDIYRKVTVLEPVSENARIAYLNMGNILDDAQRFNEAIEAYEKALALDPRDSSTLYNLGIVYKHMGKGELAIDTWRKASDLKPDDPRSMMAVADYYYEKNFLDDALSEYSRVVRRWPDVQDAHFNIATIYYKKGHFDYSLEEYKKVIEINDKNDLARKAYINIGVIQSKTTKGNEETIKNAHANVQKALLIKPGDAEALSALGSVYMEAGNLDKAIDVFYQAVSATDDTKLVSECYNNLGKCYYKQGLYKKALQAFTRGIEVEPTYEEIRINRKVAMQAYEKELDR
jgi:tetratricopeptide (TPR) repeat protein